jgi:purine/pyrimidine-nucleoside phosphorylase
VPEKPPEKFENVTVVTKANVYFGGKVVSHTVLAAGDRKTLGLIYPGQYTFNTDAPERMDITAGSCRVRRAGAKDWTTYAADSSFRVPAKSSFDIAVDSALAEYICSYE